MTFETEGVLGVITAGGVFIAAIAGAALLVVVGLKMWKRARGAA